MSSWRLLGRKARNRVTGTEAHPRVRAQGLDPHGGPVGKLTTAMCHERLGEDKFVPSGGFEAVCREKPAQMQSKGMLARHLPPSEQVTRWLAVLASPP